MGMVKLILKRDNVYKIVYDWGHKFAPGKFFLRVNRQTEFYDLVGTDKKNKGYYRFTHEESLEFTD